MTGAYDYRKFAVLCVDDEEQALKYFAKAFGNEFRVLTAASAAEAQAILDRDGRDVGVVITDQRMPNRTGVDLLGAVRGHWPAIVRILTTAYSDIESAIDAVNSGAIYKYVVKPWNIRDLRGVLMRAMEFFIVQQERDMLLRQKLHVIQRLIIADRVRSLAALAAGLSHHIRNSMMALKSFLDLTPVKLREEMTSQMVKNPAFWQDLWALAQQESEQILHIVQRVADTVVQPAYKFADDADTAQLLLDAVQAARPQLDAQTRVTTSIADGVPRVRVDAPMVSRLIAILLERTAGFDPGPRNLTVTVTSPASVWDSPAVQVRFISDGPAWSEEAVASLFTAFAPSEGDPRELGLDLLSAFFIAYHHGGEISIHRSAPSGPGFELLLPLDPDKVQRPDLHEDFLGKLFLRFDLSE